MKRKRDSGKFSVKELKPCLFFFLWLAACVQIIFEKQI